jgi:hypothetical protein
VEPGQWIGGLYLVDRAEGFIFAPSKHLIDGDNLIQRTIPHIGSAIDFPVPQSRRTFPARAFWRNDALYAITSGGDKFDETLEGGLKVKLWTLAQWHNGEWRFLGDYRTESGNYFLVIPCDNDRFIAVASRRDLTGNKNVSQWSPFHRMTLSKERKELRLNATIDHGMDDIRKYMSDPDCFGMAFSGRVAVTDDYAVIINRNTGLYWIFSLEKASLRHSGNIFKNVTPEMIAKGGFPNAILRVHPEKNGTILISAQEESAFLAETGDVVKDVQEIIDNNPSLSSEDVMKIIKLRQKELADRSPLLVWYRMDPEKGKVEKLGVPPIGAAYIREGTENDYWRPMPDGSVQMGSLDSFLVDNSKQRESKNTSATNERQQEKSDKPSSHNNR